MNTPPPSPHRSGSRRAATLLALIALCGAAPPEALADSFEDGWRPEDDRAYSKRYSGMFTELGARLGFDTGPGLKGRSVQALARAAFPMSLGDLRLAYTHHQLEGLSAEAPFSTRQRAHALTASLALHPLYLLLLKSDRFGYLAAGFYLDAGAGPRLSRVERLGADPLRELALQWSLGAGLDLPIIDPDRFGQAPWLNLSYQRQGHRLRALPAPVAIRTHSLYIGLSWRLNRLPL